MRLLNGPDVSRKVPRPPAWLSRTLSTLTLTEFPNAIDYRSVDLEGLVVKSGSFGRLQPSHHPTLTANHRKESLRSIEDCSLMGAAEASVHEEPGRADRDVKTLYFFDLPVR